MEQEVLNVDDTNRCVCCGTIIPEGRMVCPTCEREGCTHLWIYEGMVKEDTHLERIRYRCQKCGKVDERKPVDRSFFPWMFP